MREIEEIASELEDGVIEFEKLKGYIDDKLRSYQEEVFLKLKFIEKYLFKFLNLEFKLKEEVLNDSFFQIIEENFEEDIEYLDNVFLNLDYFERKDIESKEFKGEILIYDEIYTFTFTLEQDKRYLKEIKNFKESLNLGIYNFYTVDNLVNKMYRVKILNLDESITLAELRNFKYKIKYYQSYILSNKELFWNVEKVKLTSEIKVLALEDRLFYNYSFRKSKNFSYIVNEKEKYIYDIDERDENINIVSSVNEKYIWEFFKIKSIYVKNTNIFLSEIFNEYNLNRALNIANKFSKIFKIREIKTEHDEYILFDNENIKKGEKRYLGIEILEKRKYIYDELFSMKSYLESVFPGINVLIYIWKY